MKEPATIRIPAPAKVNLFLKVTGRRPDGYHDLVSVMQALEISDEITVGRTPDGIEVTCDNETVPSGQKNIAYRAAAALLGYASLNAGVTIHITKKTPVAAGLGGGSSDAAAVLKALRLLYAPDLTDEELGKIGLGLGADVPFFLGTPTAIARGVGELLSPLVSPAESWLLLVNPGVQVSTKWVYDNLNLGLTNPTKNIKLPEFLGQSLCDGPMVGFLHNDLERVTVGGYPIVNAVKERLTGEGAAGVLMSGSGPTVFGVFCSRDQALNAAGRINVPGWTVLATRTISSWPEPEPLY